MKPAFSLLLLLLFIHFEYYIVYEFLSVCKQSWLRRPSKSVARWEHKKEKSREKRGKNVLQKSMALQSSQHEISCWARIFKWFFLLVLVLIKMKWQQNCFHILRWASYAELRHIYWKEDFWLSIFPITFQQSPSSSSSSSLDSTRNMDV